MYKDHKDIPTQYRRMILEETLEKRVSKVPLSFCNEIINEHIRMQEENETLKNYQVEYYKNGEQGIREAESRQRALVEVDRILDYGGNRDPSIVIAVRQANRLVAGYVKGKWIYPEPRDKIRFVSRSCA